MLAREHKEEIRQPIPGSNDKKGTYNQGTPSQGSIPDWIQPRILTRVLDRSRTLNSNLQTPERPFLMDYGEKNVHNGIILGRNRNNNPEDLPQENDLAGSHGRNERFESQQDFQALRRRNQNQRKPGSYTIHRKFLAYGRAQSSSRTLRQGRQNSTFPTTVQNFQDLQTKDKFIKDLPVIPCSY
ncbi:hypothetical protein O181_048921 [Austropuccinia psidii MF-1]|uniref:Uncharacterized protein n=1 Tax=Austropuccinia psidii MF-1 TaxID=1389203 RepID=A0A9Q3DRI1_9BASI|nr:hypothetical protein [Austropuccinia psidii MF-1]